jgi:hypothetical protein
MIPRMDHAAEPTNPLDMADMAESLTAAIYDHLRPEGEGWDDLTGDEKAEFQRLAQVAMAAHAAYFHSHGIRVMPRGTVIVPASRDEAAAMVAIGSRYLKENPAPLLRARRLPARLVP